MNFALVGHGRMGREIERVAIARGHARAAVLDRSTGEITRESLGGAELAFEFTRPEAAEENLRRLVGASVAVVSGTTGWTPSPSFERELSSAPRGVILAPNFSVGMNLFFRVVARAAELYGGVGLHDSWVHEQHHREKRDAPSGTARLLASILDEKTPGRTVQVTSTRAGSEPGMHVVGFDGEDDVITLEHRARGRRGFALGAVLAAEWLGTRQGLYAFDDVVDDLARRGAGPRGGGR